jgi:thiamine pyrophosphokinase
MRAVIISGGSISDCDYIKKQIKKFGADFIICADSGYNHAVKMNLNVDLIVGDFDSLGDIPSSIKSVLYNAEKNYTDTEIAFTHARKMGACEFLLAGATGTRADHMLTNIFMLRSCLERGESAEIADEHNRIRMINSSLEIEGEAGKIISLVPLSDCAGVTTEGLKYTLENAELKLGTGVGVSNVMTGGRATVSLGTGTLLMIEAWD